MQRRLIEGKIKKDFLSGIKRLFEENLAFGFIGGGFAKGYWDKNHDIDMFICIKKEIDHKKAKAYLEWYFDLHKKHGFPPDKDYPGEIIKLDDLLKALKILDTLKLELKVNDISVKEAIIWADMIAGKNFGFIGDGKIFSSLRKKHAKYPEKWKKEILKLISSEDRKRWKNESYLLIMERFMQYPKNDARAFYKKYGLNKRIEKFI